MARFVDLDDEPEEGDRQSQMPSTVKPEALNGDVKSKLPEEPRERVLNSITGAFHQWPIAQSIISHIDINDLDALARTSHSIHDGLIQYKDSLMSSTLRCVNQDAPVDPGESIRYRARAGNWFYMEDGRAYNGKSGDCARDMVAECRRCGDVVCRNCTIKPPAPIAMRDRHRRLCRACARAPIASVLTTPLQPDMPLTCHAVQRAICQCATTGVWLCQPCGRSIRANDQDYQQIWRWRSHYGEILGGLGTGIGDGDRGVPCVREELCVAAKCVEEEIDCDAEDSRNGNTPPESQYSHLQSSYMQAQIGANENRTPSPSMGPGYARHEIEGIGGRVKRKFIRMKKVGACVPEYSDEKGPGRKALVRESKGLERSWCGWCRRPVPGKKDLEPGETSSSDEELEKAMDKTVLGCCVSSQACCLAA